MLEQSDIGRRVPVWHALSQLFLDTELQPPDYESIARRLRRSGYPPDEIRRILKDEVAPAFLPNLLSPAGEWAGWSEDEVRNIVLRSLERRRPLTRLIGRWAHPRHVDGEWRKLAPLLTP